MVVLVEQLGLIERKIPFPVSYEHVAAEFPATFVQLLASSEQRGIGIHHEHELEADTPWIHLRLTVTFLSPEDACTAVHLAGDLHVTMCAENGTGARIGIEQREVLSRQNESTFFLAKLLRLVQEESEFRFWTGTVGAAQSE